MASRTTAMVAEARESSRLSPVGNCRRLRFTQAQHSWRSTPTHRPEACELARGVAQHSWRSTLARFPAACELARGVARARGAALRHAPLWRRDLGGQSRDQAQWKRKARALASPRVARNLAERAKGGV